jgi:outer membrane protein OmpA-like peptidoglycan-associated protein
MACLEGETTYKRKGDKDNDGVKDKKDLCPEIKGPKKNKGCPNITIELWTSFYVALSDVYFESNSDSISKDSFLPLDTIATLMKQNKGFILKISGYADNEGTSETNQLLSKKRAEAVEEYLKAKGVPNKRIRVAAFGEKMPKAPNTTASGRAVNRRVEFDLFY